MDSRSSELESECGGPSNAQSGLVFRGRLFAMVDDQHLCRVPFLLQIEPELLDCRKNRGPDHSSVELLLHHPFQAQVVRAGKTCAIDDGTVAEVSGRERS